MPICAPCFLTCQHNRVITSGSGHAAAMLRAMARIWSGDTSCCDRRPLGGRLHPGGVRPLPGDRQALGLAGWAEYGYCASHSRYFWGLRLHLVCTLCGLPVIFALTGAKADERETLLGMLAADPDLVATHPRQKLIADKNYYGNEFEAELVGAGIPASSGPQGGETACGTTVLQTAATSHRVDQQHVQGATGSRTTRRAHCRRRRRPRPARSPRADHRDLAQRPTGQPIMRSLTAYDH